MMHTNYQPPRKGVIDGQIMAAKRLRVLRNGQSLAAIGDLLHATKVEFQRKQLAYSDRGDFTRCYRGGF
ncbi:hypothetical protein QAC_7 [Pseudomonas phage QAC]|uniref:Uncharacterized protein n=2 Tax=Ghunavirus 17A TaxID=2733618 RepID=A0AAE9BNQ5_9CAUD|nr:hypothetical protein QAC_7 [Pseudomonas phage QAC]